jgi:hypothetical protein
MRIWGHTDETLDGLKIRLVRYQELAELLATNPASTRFPAVVSKIQQQQNFLDGLRLTREACTRSRKAMSEEMNAIIAESRSALFASKLNARGHPFGAEDLREESRLCLEEARGCVDHQERLQFARHAFDLAQLGEAVALRERR